jgi:hypothetical protein
MINGKLNPLKPIKLYHIPGDSICILYTNLVNIRLISGSEEKDHKKSEPLGTKGIRSFYDFFLIFIVYAGIYTSLIDQRFRFLKMPGGCIKKRWFMQSFYFDFVLLYF